MSHPEAPQPEATAEVVREEGREETRESPQDPSQRQFLKTLFGSAAGIAGLAIAGELTNPAPAEAAYTAGGVVPTDNNFPLPDYTNTTGGDLVNTNLRIDGHLAVKGYRPWVDVTAYGASGLAVHFQDTAVQAAFAAVPDRGGVVYFPPGIYVLQQPIVVPTKHIAIVGAGRGATTLVFNYSGGIFIDHGHQSYTVTIRDLTIVANPATAINAPAIKYHTHWLQGSEHGNEGLASPHIHDVTIFGPFRKGIEIKDGCGAKIERFEVRGSISGAHPGYMTHGIHLIGNSTINNIAAGYITGVDTGIEVGDTTEGSYIRGVEVVGARVGYKIISPKPGSAISDCHAATYEHGIYIVDHGEMALTGNLLYGGGTTSQWTGIHAEGTGGAGDNGVSARRLRIIGNTITSWEGAPSPTRMGLYVSGTVHDCTIQGNVLTFLTHGIVFTGVGTNNNIVLGNRIKASIGAWYPAGSGNVFEHNITTP